MSVSPPFAKLFDTSNGQFLVTLSYDDGLSLHYRAAERHGITMESRHGPWPATAEGDAAARAKFDSFTQADAELSAAAFAASLESFVDSAQPEDGA